MWRKPFLIVFLMGLTPASACVAAGIRVTPAEAQLRGNFDRLQLIVTQLDEGGNAGDRSEDLTSTAQYTSNNPAVATVSAGGRLVAIGNGAAVVTVSINGQSLEVPVTVADVVETPSVGYLEHIAPIISKLGCNMGACHAAQHGKGGLKLSVFNFEPEVDRNNIARDRQQRRVDFNEPAQSLVLRKPTMDLPHGGGKRLEGGSVEYQTLRAWIAGGAPAPNPKAARLTKIEVFPKQRVGRAGFRQQLRVVATFTPVVEGDAVAEPQVRDITALARYDSMDDGVVTVDRDGLCTTVGSGQAAVMVRYEGLAELAMFVLPYREQVTLAGWENQNYVDELAANKFRELGIEPSPLCDDATFVRRAFLDAIGTLPTVEQTEAFLKSEDPKKRDVLIDQLLGLTGDPAQDIHNDAYAAFWTLRWSDLIRNTSTEIGEQGMWAMHNWLKEVLRTNRPYNEIVRELITAKGSIYSSGPANYYRIFKDNSELTEGTAQLFLGIRLECAKCHHHPFEKYGQGDYYGFAAFFSRVGTKNVQEFGLFGGESAVVVNATGEVRHPRTGATMKPTPLDSESVDDPLDRRLPLADWLTSEKNEYFSRAVVNRYMGFLLGRGLVDPVDDMRSTNPPSNPELMDRLAKDFAANQFNLKHLIRTIMKSRLYQLDSQPTPENQFDRKFYSFYKVKRVAAEPLLDAIDRATESPTKFQNLPLWTRAIELPDAEYPDVFLNTFAKPKRASVCECERVSTQNLVQALHTLNGDVLANKIASGTGRVARLVNAKKPHAEIVDELYMASLCRHPTAEELKASEQFLAESPNPTEFYQDLLWALLNSKQFLFVR